MTAGSLWTAMHGEGGVNEDAVLKLVNQIEKETRDEPVLNTAAAGGEGGRGERLGAFSVHDLRLELDRLRLHVAGLQSNVDADEDPATCAVPTSAPVPGPSTLVTPIMEAMLGAVVRDDSRTVGFLGVGGVGKTTITAWVVHQRETRVRFDRIVWITHGQTPHLERLTADIYLQLTGMAVLSKASRVP